MAGTVWRWWSEDMDEGRFEAFDKREVLIHVESEMTRLT